MKKIYKIIAFTLSIIIFLNLFAAIFKICPPQGPWLMPPWCEGPEIGTGIETKSTFLVNVPYNTPETDLFLKIDGKELIKMDKINDYSYQTTIDVIGQETLNYRYTSISGESNEFSTKITQRNSIIFDGVSSWSNLEFNPNINYNFGINMMDTWGRNYNFNMIENTHNNIDTSFARVKRLGAKQIIVHDFLWITYEGKGKANVDLNDLNYIIEPDVFWNDFRDEGMTQEDLNKLAKTAHDNNMQIIWRLNFAMNNIGDYIGKDITEEVADDWSRVTGDKTEEWVNDFLDKWKQTMLTKAEMLNQANFDVMVITPTWHNPTYQPYEELANQKWKEIISEVQKTFNGKVGVQVGAWGFLDKQSEEDWSKYDYYTKADQIYLEMQYLPKYNKNLNNPTIDEMKERLLLYLNDLGKEATKENIKLNLLIGFTSKENGFHERLNYHAEEYYRPEVKALKSDYKHQSNAFEAFFQSTENKEFIESVSVEGFWWDDTTYPKDTKIRLDIALTPRNKNAEAVLMKWGNAIN